MSGESRRAGSGQEGAKEPTGQRPFARLAFEDAVLPVGVAGMLTCLAISLSQLVSSVMPGWPRIFVPVFTFLVALESIHSQRFMERKRLRGRDRTRFRFVEWVVILLAVRFGIYARLGASRLVEDLALWSANPGAFFDLRFIIISLIVFAFWMTATVLSEHMQKLKASPLEKPLSPTDPQYDMWVTMPQRGRVDRQQELRSIMSIFFGGGVVLLLLTGLNRVDLNELLSLQNQRVSGVILNVLIYFLIAFLLISQARYTTLKANWELQEIPIAGRLDRRWLSLAILFLLLVAFISALLPVGYSVGIIEILGMALHWAIYSVLQVVMLIVFAFSYALSLLLSLFSREKQPFEAPPRPTVPFTPPPQETGTVGVPLIWWQLVRSLLFWFILTGVVGYSLYHFLGMRWSFLRRLSLRGVFGWVRRLLAALGSGTGKAVRDLRDLLAQQIAARRARILSRPMRFLSLRRLSPRQRMRYYYLSILYRSRRQGFGRPPAMTPLEYQEMLLAQMPELSMDVGDLTAAFIEARYSQHVISKEDTRRIEPIWKRIKRWIVQRKPGSTAPTEASKK